MTTFVKDLDHALDQLPAAKRFAASRGFAIAKYYGGWLLGCVLQMFIYFSCGFGLAFLAVVIASSFGYWESLRGYVAWALGIGFLGATLWPVLVSHWDLKAHQKCLMLTNKQCGAKDIVQTIELCAKSGATDDQLIVLQHLAKDNTVPSNWWAWVDQKARQVIHITQTQSNEQAQRNLEMTENAAAQHKIDNGTILS